MIKLLDSIFNIISWVIVTIIYVGPVYIALIFIANSKIGDNIKIKFGISENEKQESFILKTLQHPLFSLLTLVTLIWFYYKNLDAKYLSSVLFLFSLPLVPLFLNILENKFKFSVNKKLSLFVLLISLTSQFALYNYIENKSFQIDKLEKLVQNKNSIISSVKNLSSSRYDLIQIDSVWKSIDTNEELKSDKLAVKSTLYSRVLNDASDFISKLDYDSAINYLNYIVSKGLATSEVHLLLGNSYLQLGDKVSAIRSYRTSANLGNQNASELYEKLNPLKKRVSYYVTLCCDGTYSYSTGRGTCSWHGGVCQWNYPIYETYRDY
jgi:hypothetical protein